MLSSRSVFGSCEFQGRNPGRNPFNQNFRAEVRKFLGVEWIATGPKGLVPFHSQNEFLAHLQRCKMKDVGLLWLVLS